MNIDNFTERVAKFEKISYDQFKKDAGFYADNVYDTIEMPCRATKNSAGYDIKTPIALTIKPHETAKFPTGLRCKMLPQYVLMIFIRSSLGIKKGITLSNGTGIIDSDYYNADNEGHIWVSLTNHSDETFTCNAGDKICQGIFVRYGITEDDNVNIERTGGIGSTGR